MTVFWLVLAVLVAAVFFGLWLVAHSRLEKPNLILIEPLNLIKNWQIARFDGAGSQVEAALKAMLATKTGEASWEKILPPLKGKLPKTSLLGSRHLPLVGEQKLVEESGKKFSYIIGEFSEVKARLILTAAEQKTLQKLENSAGAHGFLALLVGRTAVHGETPRLESLQHVYLGAVLLEPVLDQKAAKQFGELASAKKILTVLPAALAENLAEKVGLTGQTFDATAAVSAETFDQKVQAAAVIASADADARYRVTANLKHLYRCQHFQVK